MKTNRRTFIKRMNWGLAGIIGMLGFAGCGKANEETCYTVKGTVVSKVNKRSIEGVRVRLGHSGYCGQGPFPMYGPPPTHFNSYVLTNAMGKFTVTDCFNDKDCSIVGDVQTLFVLVEDINSEENRLFQSEFVPVDMRGRKTATVTVELTEIGKG